MTTLTTIEKAAKLMGYEVASASTGGCVFIFVNSSATRLFNPYTSKSYLMDVECELGISVRFGVKVVTAYPRCENIFCDVREDDHPTKFTARAHAVMAVVEQIYDARFGKDGE